MSGKVVDFGRDAEFYKRRAAGLREQRPADAMKFLYRALEMKPDDPKALTEAAAIALDAGRPRLAVRLAARAIHTAEGSCLLGIALERLGFFQPALTALAASIQQSDSPSLRATVLETVTRIQRREGDRNRRDTRLRKLQNKARTMLLDGRYESAVRFCLEQDAKYPDSPFVEPLADSLWRQKKFAQARMAAHVSGALLPIAGRRAKTGFISPDSVRAMRAAMLAGDWASALSAPEGPGPERQYMRAAASARMGEDREKYLPILLDMQAMDPEDPAVDWALRLISQGRDREMPRLYGVCPEAETALCTELWSGNPGKTAIRWGIRKPYATMIAAWVAVRREDGEWLLRDALADPLLPESSRRIVSVALSRVENAAQFVGVTPDKLWVGGPWEPDSVRLPGAVIKILRAAIEVSPPEMAGSLFKVWAALVDSRDRRRAGRDVSGWAAAVALAARELDGQDRVVEVMETRRARERSRWLLKRASKEKWHEMH